MSIDANTEIESTDIPLYDRQMITIKKVIVSLQSLCVQNMKLQ